MCLGSTQTFRGLNLLWSQHLLPDLCIHDLVAASSAACFDCVALEWQGNAMAYAELMESAGRVAAWLLRNHAGAERVVLLQLNRSLEQAVCMLGVLLSNGAYLPLDSLWPLDRRKSIAADSACGQLVAQPVHAAELACSFRGAVRMLDDAFAMPS